MLTLKNVIHTSIIEARKEAGVALAVISENRLLANNGEKMGETAKRQAKQRKKFTIQQEKFMEERAR